jgi:hypothetical protein
VGHVEMLGVIRNSADEQISVTIRNQLGGDANRNVRDYGVKCSVKTARAIFAA